MESDSLRQPRNKLVRWRFTIPLRFHVETSFIYIHCFFELINRNSETLLSHFSFFTLPSILSSSFSSESVSSLSASHHPFRMVLAAINLRPLLPLRLAFIPPPHH